jgi:hypothetical protein
MKQVPKVLDAIVDKVLAYRPKPKSKPARRRKRRAAKIAKGLIYMSPKKNHAMGWTPTNSFRQVWDREHILDRTEVFVGTQQLWISDSNESKWRWIESVTMKQVQKEETE